MLKLLYNLLSEIEVEIIDKDTNYFNKNMVGMCAIVSLLVYKRLKENGYTPQIVVNEAHCFVVEDDFIVDLTSIQFDQGFLLLRKRENLGNWKEIFITGEIEKFIEYLYKEKWDLPQIPSEFKKINQWYSKEISSLINSKSSRQRSLKRKRKLHIHN